MTKTIQDLWEDAITERTRRLKEMDPTAKCLVEGCYNIGLSGNGFYWCDAHTYRLPAKLKRRWWRETNYNEKPPSEELLAQVRQKLRRGACRYCGRDFSYADRTSNLAHGSDRYCSDRCMDEAWQAAMEQVAAIRAELTANKKQSAP
jgi:hypothetical protein